MKVKQLGCGLLTKNGIVQRYFDVGVTSPLVIFFLKSCMGEVSGGIVAFLELVLVRTFKKCMFWLLL